MAGRGYRLAENISAVGNYPANAAAPGGAGVAIQGGHFAFSIIATTFPTTAALQLLGQDNATWITVAVAAVNSALPYWLPSGTYRLSLAGGGPAGVYADLVSLPSM